MAQQLSGQLVFIAQLRKKKFPGLFPVKIEPISVKKLSE